MRIYTRTGDSGETGLIGGRRVRKDDARVEACGAVDELNAAIGWARAVGQPSPVDQVLAAVQCDLFQLGADLAAPPDVERPVRLDAERTRGIEATIDRFDAHLPPLQRFILPGGAPAAAALHLARTACRRAERRAVALTGSGAAATETVVFLNRLSDLLFVLARVVNRAAGIPDVAWQPDLPLAQAPTEPPASGSRRTE